MRPTPAEPSATAIPIRLRHLPHGRRILGWEEISAGQLAKAIKRAPGYVCLVLNGRKRASIDTYRAMAKSLGIGLDKLMERIDQSKKLNELPKYTAKYQAIVSGRKTMLLRSEHAAKSSLIEHDGQTYSVALRSKRKQ